MTDDRHAAASRRFAINVRIPGWARNEPVPSDLYRFTDEIDVPPATIRVNGDAGVDDARQEATSRSIAPGQPGDVIALDLPMPVRRVESNPQVMANRDRVALQRGPIVFAAEWPDNPNGKVRNIVLPDGNALSERVPARPAERRAGD